MEEAKRKVVLIGAGKIGKGYIADIFNEAGYQLVFLCHSLKQAEELRQQGYYTLYKYCDGEVEPRVSKIEGYEAYSTAAEYEQSVAALANTNYATVHLYPGAFASVGHMVGDAIKERVRLGKTDTLDVMLCLNYIDPDLIIRKHIEERLETEAEWDDYRNNVGIVLALTFRWGGNPRPYMLQEDPLCSCVAESPDLPVDREAFKGPIPTDVALRPLAKMRERLAFKIWGGNVNHCIMSYVGYAKGLTYTFEAEADDEAYKIATLATKEAHFGYDQEYTLTDAEKAENHRGRHQRDRSQKSKAMEQVRKDELTRVGADPGRKLARRDRIIGPALACIKNGKVPYFLTRAAAYAFLFDAKEDGSAVEIQTYTKENGIAKAIEKFCQLDLADVYDKQIFELVLANYYDICDVDPFVAAY